MLMRWPHDAGYLLYPYPNKCHLCGCIERISLETGSMEGGHGRETGRRRRLLLVPAGRGAGWCWHGPLSWHTLPSHWSVATGSAHMVCDRP